MNEYLKMKNLIMRMLCIVFYVFWSFNSFAQKENQIDWKSDIEFLKNELPKRHKNLFFKYSREDFYSSLDQLKVECSMLTDLQVALRLQQVIVKVGDAHTNIDYKKYLGKGRNLPFSIVWYTDGLTINLSTNQNDIIVGTKLKKVNGFPVEVIIDSLSTLFVVDNEACKLLSVPRMITNYQLLNYFGFTKEGNPEIEVESTDGKTLIHTLLYGDLSKSTIVEKKAEVVPYYLSHPELLFTEKYFEEDSLYFVQYNKCWSRELEEQFGDKNKAKNLSSFTEFEQVVFKTFKERPIKKLIVDLRFNSGGASPQGTEFIKQIAEDKSVNKKGVIYVVIGRRTFSSGIINVLDFKKYTNAIIIGEETAGRPNHFGEVKKFNLPSSDITVGYSTKYFSMTSEKENSIVPDIKCRLDFSDYINGVDPVYNYVRNQ